VETADHRILFKFECKDFKKRAVVCLDSNVEELLNTFKQDWMLDKELLLLEEDQIPADGKTKLSVLDFDDYTLMIPDSPTARVYKFVFRNSI
jgi:hypothetical protein